MNAVLCTRCGVEYHGASCPNCRVEAHNDEETDWRRELKRKLAEHIEKKQAPAAQPNREVTAPRPRSRPARVKKRSPDEIALFDYKRREEGKEPEGRAVKLAVRTSPAQRPAEKPVVRRPVSPLKPPRPQPHLPRQQSLSLEASPRPPAAAPQEPPPPEIPISREIIFSRILAGIVDLCLPLLISSVFTFSAARVLNFDFISAVSIRLGIVFWASFFVLNSFFFLLLNGQTPGMLLTDLHLVGEEGEEEIPFQSLALRILLFVPILASGVGLIWGIFDPMCRCGHDLLSKTRIVPASPE